MDDPTLFVIKKMKEVLEELRVTVEVFYLYEQKNSIPTLPQTLKNADGVILATTLEWYGIGGYMQLFLDACWLYGDKEKISRIYMCPIVMSTTYGEQEGKLNLATAWEILGGLPCSGLCGYVENLASFRMNRDYTEIIEKKAENLYRAISQKRKSLPNSNQAVKQSILRTQQLELTPQESEQLSKFASNDLYVKKQKEDIEELSNMFKDMLGQSKEDEDTAYLMELEAHFVPQEDFSVTYLFMIDGKKKPLTIEVQNDELQVHYGQGEKIDVYTKLSPEVMDGIIQGRMTFQRAFMTGEMTAKGNLKNLKMLDQIFRF